MTPTDMHNSRTAKRKPGIDFTTVAESLRTNVVLAEATLNLKLDACRIQLGTNSEKLIKQLSRYFSHVCTDSTEADIHIVAIERDAPDLPSELGIEFIDWQREPGKTGRKDSYFDLPDARIVRKVRTGMVFLQTMSECVAAGPCLDNDNQVINFINAQYMNWLQQRGWRICHAAGLVSNQHVLGMAGFSGGGKSTLMLHMLEQSGRQFLSNDRLFVKRDGNVVQAAGIPKMPRINPGTIVHNPRLHPLIPEEERTKLLAMPSHALWQLEDKYDVMIDEVFGQGRVATKGILDKFLVLNWQHDSVQATKITQVDLSERHDLLGAIMKSPGPFYQYADKTFFQDRTPLEEESYLSSLEGVAVYEVSGRVDFDSLVAQLNKRGW